jgi:hypothetical protein
MGELDPRIEKVRRFGIGVFLALSVAAIPIAIHIVKTYESPELWLTLLGAVFMLVLICLYALETALMPIPKGTQVTPLTVDPDADTILEEPDDDIEEHTEFHEPTLAPSVDKQEEVDEAAILVEVEEVPTHPPFAAGITADLADQATELDPDRSHLRNPDAPMLTLPSAALRNDNESPDDENESEEDQG